MKELKKYIKNKNIKAVLVCGCGNSVRSEIGRIVKFIEKYNPVIIGINGFIVGLMDVFYSDPKIYKLMFPDIMVSTIKKEEMFAKYFLEDSVKNEILKYNTAVVSDPYYVDPSLYFESCIIKIRDKIKNKLSSRHLGYGGVLAVALGTFFKPKYLAHVGIGDNTSKYKYFWRRDSIDWTKKEFYGKGRKQQIVFNEKFGKYIPMYNYDDPGKRVNCQFAAIKLLTNGIKTTCLNKEVREGRWANVKS